MIELGLCLGHKYQLVCIKRVYVFVAIVILNILSDALWCFEVE